MGLTFGYPTNIMPIKALIIAKILLKIVRISKLYPFP